MVEADAKENRLVCATHEQLAPNSVVYIYQPSGDWSKTSLGMYSSARQSIMPLGRGGLEDVGASYSAEHAKSATSIMKTMSRAAMMVKYTGPGNLSHLG